MVRKGGDDFANSVVSHSHDEGEDGHEHKSNEGNSLSDRMVVGPKVNHRIPYSVGDR